MASEQPESTADFGVAADPGGDRELDELIPEVYGELCQLASAYLKRERPDHTLQTYGLVHEAYLKLVGQNGSRWRNRAQFFAIAARVMRRILLDHARRRGAQKRGGDAIRISLEKVPGWSGSPHEDLLELDRAMQQLSAVDDELGRIVELKFFGGLTHDEIAEVLGCAAITVKRRWRVARARLYTALQSRGDGGE